jgi:hypothetical protein
MQGGGATTVAYEQKSLGDYIEVGQRIADFREQYPEGSLQPADLAHPWEQATVTGYDKDGREVTQCFIVYVAAAYRTPDDQRPGVGIAWEVFPGRTNFTRGSEIQNAETSAWGRAIIAVLASDSKRGVASREEVRNRSAEREDGLPVNKDGSLSRSKTTDEEKEKAGVMTAGQLAEHTALQPKRAEQTGKVTRIKLPEPDDPWQDQPAGALPVPPEDQPGTIDPKDQRAIMAHYSKEQAANGQTGEPARAARMAAIQSIIGRPVHSTNELSFQEGRRVRDKLKGAAT